MKFFLDHKTLQLFQWWPHGSIHTPCSKRIFLPAYRSKKLMSAVCGIKFLSTPDKSYKKFIYIALKAIGWTRAFNQKEKACFHPT